MNIKDALSILALTAAADQKVIKTAYRKACIKYHPDRNPAGLEMMKAVNVAYQFLAEISYNGADHPIDEEVNTDFGDMLNEAINSVIGLSGLNIEVCGAWVWLTGNTKQYKAAGYWWAKKKCSWYFRPADYKSRNKGDWNMDKIRDKYGSVSVNNQPRQQTALAH
ncbi:MAG: DnaJ domain-containing protein [Methylomarinum sp.]|nr:DnaJ domain-containing protein [Methylomarinum sp.]